jgi:tetratricopeptide (TPR) repeat protein
MHYLMSKALCLVCFAVALAATPARAQIPPEVRWCFNPDNEFSPELQIKGCTALLQSGRGTAEVRGQTFALRGIAYGNKKEYDKAIADFSDAIKLKFQVDLILVKRGFVYALKEDYDRAIADYSRAIQLNDKVADYFLERGRVHGLRDAQHLLDHDRHDAKEAIADFDQAIKLDAKLAQAYFYRGIMKRLNFPDAGGDADITRACELDPKVDDECSRAKVLGSPGCNAFNGSASDPHEGGALIANNLVFTAGDTINASITGAGNTLTLKNDLIWPTNTYQGPAEAISYPVPTSGAYKFALLLSHPTTPYTAVWSCTPAISAAPNNPDSTSK